MATTEENTRTAVEFPAPHDRPRRPLEWIDHPVLAVAMVEGGRIRLSNRAWKRLFAMPDDVSVESHVAALFSNAQGADRFEKTLQARLTAASEHGPAFALGEQTMTRRDATTFIAEVMVWPTGAFDGNRLLSADAMWQVRDVSAERTLRRDLRGLEDYYRELTRHQRDLTFVIDRKGRLSYVSSSVEAVLGYRVEALLGESFAKLFDAGQRVNAGQWLRAASRESRAQHIESYHLRVIAKDGGKRVLACRPRNCFAMPSIAGMVVHALDVSDATADPADRSFASGARESALRSRIAALARSPTGTATERLTTLLDEACAALDGRVAVLWECDERGAWSATGIARAAADGFLSSGSSISGSSSSERIPPLIGGVPSVPSGAPLVVEDIGVDEAAATARVEVEAAGVHASIEVPVFVDGTLKAIVAVGAAEPRRWETGEVDFVLAIALMTAAAIGSRASAAATGSIAMAEAVDPLTGLTARTAAAQRLEQLVVSATAANESLGALVVDLDRLRDINDRFGNDIGDAVIVRAAKTLGSFVGPGDVVARIGDDQFLLVLREPSAGALDTMAQDLLQRLAEPDDRGTLPRIESSIGLARLAADHSGGDSLWRRAELAAREAKARGRGQVVIFQPRLAAAVTARKVLGDEIEDAIQQQQFALFYQPQIALATGSLVGFEAFLRWQHPTRGLLLPAVFIDAAIDRGLSEAITRTVFAQVCDQVVLWRQVKDFPDVPVNVNVSGEQFNDRRLPAIVAAALMRSGLPARSLVLEVIEQNFLFDALAMERVVGELARLGVRLSVGSFGLGHVSLRSARELGVAQIKLNRGFVEGLPDDAESAVVVKAAIEIAEHLNGQVVAEGVETRAQYECLRALGCEAAQGFYFGAPLSADEILSFVASNREHPVH